VIANFRSYREQLRLLGGITNLMGFTTAFVSLKRDARHAGKSSYTLKKLLSLAMDITMAYSDKPLKISLFIGTLLSGISLLVGMLIFLLAIANIIEVPGWASVMVSIYFMGGVSLANLGLIGYYVGKTFDQTKNRPIYVIESDTHESVGHSNTHDQHAFPSVLWITGLSSSGKTTIGKKIIKYNEAHGQKSIFLDGDELREVFAATVINNANHGREARLNLAMQYSRLCKTLSQQGFKIVISTISLFKEVHQWNRHNINDYFEVYLKVPLEELKRRDPKGLYKAFDDGKIDNIAGLDLDIDEPQAPDLTLVHSPEVSADMQFEKLLKHLSERVHS
jgi:adenylylsulfate kinase